MSERRLPDAVLAAIATAIAEEMGTTPDRLRLHIAGLTPPEHTDEGWRLAARISAMRPTRFPRG